MSSGGMGGIWRCGRGGDRTRGIYVAIDRVVAGDGLVSPMEGALTYSFARLVMLIEDAAYVVALVVVNLTADNSATRSKEFCYVIERALFLMRRRCRGRAGVGVGGEMMVVRVGWGRCRCSGGCRCRC